MTSCTVDADLISQLPEHIIHHILSFLPTKDVVRVSVLSKEWYGLFTYFPISDFSHSNFEDYHTKFERRLEFVIFVYTSLLRQSLHSRYIPKFELSLTRESNNTRACSSRLEHEFTILINRCLQLSTRHGVKELALEFPEGIEYRLPKAIFFSAKQLAVCRLASCIINAPTINWPSLREFSLKEVALSDQRIIDNLIFTCPFIEKFAMDFCRGLDYLTLSGLKKLKEVKVKWTRTKKIEVDALSLKTFSFSGTEDDTEINIVACENLEVLKLKYSRLTVRAAQDLISKFPALKVLILGGYEFDSIKISNQRLERLELFSGNMVETIIDAPRLNSLKYMLTRIPSLFSVNTSSLHEVDLELFRHCSLLELNKFLKNFNQIRLVNLYIPYDIYCGAPEIVRDISNPAKVTDINRLELEVDLKDAGDHAIAEAAQEALVDGLFWTCHPKSLLVATGWSTNNEFMKFLCKKLMLREKEQHCCAPSAVKCWLHDIKGVNIEHCGSNGERKAVTFSALLDSLQTIAKDEEIYFLFTW